MHVTLTNLLNEMINQGASDLHLSADMGPRMRIEGTLYEIDAAPLDRPTLWTWLESELTEGQIDAVVTYVQEFYQGKQMSRAKCLRYFSVPQSIVCDPFPQN